MSDYLRDQLNRQHREKLHRQIGALEAQLEYLGRPLMMWERIRVAKLKNKIDVLKARLLQPMLLDPFKPRGVNQDT